MPSVQLGTRISFHSRQVLCRGLALVEHRQRRCKVVVGSLALLLYVEDLSSVACEAHTARQQ